MPAIRQPLTSGGTLKRWYRPSRIAGQDMRRVEIGRPAPGSKVIRIARNIGCIAAARRIVNGQVQAKPRERFFAMRLLKLTLQDVMLQRS